MSEPPIKAEEQHVPAPDQADEAGASYQEIVKKMEELGYIDCGLDI